MIIEEFLQRTFLGNTVESYCWFVGILLLGVLFKRLLSRLLTLFVFKFLQKYSTGVAYEKLLILLKKPLGTFILLVAFYFAFSRIDFPKEWNICPIEKFGLRIIIWRSYEMAAIMVVTWIFLRLVDFFGLIMMYRASLTESKIDDQLVPFVKESIKVIITILAIFFILGTVFKLNIASLIAGLGIGGLAIALAAKESLENLMGSFTIFLDKPFIVGDLIKSGSIEGTVEKIGFRSTRIRTAEKSCVTVPNKKLIDSELDNLSLRTQRRAKFNIGLTYETTSEKIKVITDEIKNYIEQHPQVLNHETKVRLSDFEPSAISIMVVFFVDTIEYEVYLTVREEINYKIIEIVQKNGSNFAYPTTSVVIKNNLPS